MEARAVQKYIRQSPKKIRQVLEIVKGKDVERALNVLHFTPKKAARVIEKTIRSAVSNFLNSNEGSKVDPEDLVIYRAYVDSGPTMRRYRARSMGRANIIRKRSSHLTIYVKPRQEKRSNQE